jgi:hypothetical protein
MQAVEVADGQDGPRRHLSKSVDSLQNPHSSLDCSNAEPGALLLEIMPFEYI